LLITDDMSVINVPPQVDSGKVSRRVGRLTASGGPIPWYFTTVDIL
jgi:hypothetical protein